MSHATRDAWTKHVTLKQLRPAKYGNKKTTVDGITFDSKKEAQRYHELKLREKAGEIRSLQLQFQYPLMVPSVIGNGGPYERVCLGKYIADFRYEEFLRPGRSKECRTVVEDVKGFKTPLYRWKKKHFEAQYGIKIRET